MHYNEYIAYDIKICEIDKSLTYYKNYKEKS